MDGDRLTDEETALVLRRAVELHSQADPDPGGLDAAALEEVAVEAGLSREAVRRALAELRLGTLVAAPASRRPRSPRLFGPGTLAVSRVVPYPAVAAEDAVHGYLEGQLFHVLRHTGGRSLWAPRQDLKATVQRSIDRKVQRRLVLGDVSRVQVAVVSEPGSGEARALVHLEVDVGDVRRASTGMVVTGGAVGAAALGGSLLVAGLDPVTAAALPAGAAMAFAGHRMGASHYRERVSAIDIALQGMFDDLERGARTGGRRTR